MRNGPSMLYRAAASLAMGLLAAATLNAGMLPQENEGDRCAALTVFQQRVEAYAALHRHLAAAVRMPGAKLDRHSPLASRSALAAAIRNARPNAQRGDLFTPEAAPVFRGILRDTLQTPDLWGFTLPMDEDGRMTMGVHPQVHDPYPAGETQEVPAIVLFWLPTLPEELEYRLVDYDLVLWDVYADLIVDVLPYAVAHPMSDAIYR